MEPSNAVHLPSTCHASALRLPALPRLADAPALLLLHELAPLQRAPLPALLPLAARCRSPRCCRSPLSLLHATSNGQKVSVALEELGLDYDVHVINIRSGAHVRRRAPAGSRQAVAAQKRRSAHTI